MPCEHEADTVMPGYCKKCGKPMAAAAPLMGTTLTLSPVAGGVLRVVLVGHGTHSDCDGSFPIARDVVLYFKVDHGSSAMGTDNSVVYLPSATLQNPHACPDYRLWPMVGERIVGDAGWIPYHHAHRAEHINKLAPGRVVFMYSARSGDGPRLSSIVNRVRALVPAARLEFVWLACRTQGVDKYAAQGKMVFPDHEPPVVFR